MGFLDSSYGAAGPAVLTNEVNEFHLIRKPTRLMNWTEQCGICPPTTESSSGVRTVTFATAQPVCSRPWDAQDRGPDRQGAASALQGGVSQIPRYQQSSAPADLVIHPILDNVGAQ